MHNNDYNDDDELLYVLFFVYIQYFIVNNSVYRYLNYFVLLLACIISKIVSK